MSVNALQNALTGLQIHQQLLDVTARNVANVSTEGYTRKTLPLETNIGADGTPLGVTAGNLQRSVSDALRRDLWRQISSTAYHESRAGYLNRLQELHGAPDSASSIAGRLGALSDSFTALAADVDSAVLQADVVREARAWALQVNQVADAVQQARNDVQIEIDSTVREINDRVEAIDAYNVAIAREIAINGSTAELEDKRDSEVKALAGLIDITYFIHGNGEMEVQLEGARPLTGDRAITLHFTPQRITYDHYHPGNFAGGIHYDDPAGPDLTQTTLGGKLGALVELRDTSLATQQVQLDELAHKTALRLEQQGLQLFVDERDGDIAADIGGAYVGFANHIRVEQLIINQPRLLRDGFAPAAAPPHAPPPGATDGQLGDASLVLDIVQFAFGSEEADGTAHTITFNTSGLGPGGGAGANLDTGLPAEATLLDFARQMVTRQSADHANAVDRAATERTYRETLSQRMSDESAVDIDEELGRMIEIQQAYGASAQMMRTINQLFDQLLATV